GVQRPGTTPGVPGAGIPGGAFPGGAGGQLVTSTSEPLLIELRITVDPRTNSLIVAGSPSDLLRVQAIISTLEDAPDPVEQRHNEVYHLHNSTAVDVANALTTYWNQTLDVLTDAGVLTAFVQGQREVVVVAEPITNKLLISATPRYYSELLHLIQELDAER